MQESTILSKKSLIARNSFCKDLTEKNSCIITFSEYSKVIKDIASGHDLILLDLDDVVFKSSPDNNAPGCIKEFRNKFRGKNFDDPTIRQKLVDTVHKCINKEIQIAVSKKLVVDFCSLSTKKIVLGLTHRNKIVSAATARELKNVGMKFSDTTTIKPNEFIDNGVIFAGFYPKTSLPRSKGKILQNFITEKYFGNVKSVFFMDDSIENIQDVKQAIDKNILFTGIHFPFCDKAVIKDKKK